VAHWGLLDREIKYHTGVVNRLRVALPRGRGSHPRDVSSLKRTDQFWIPPTLTEVNHKDFECEGTATLANFTNHISERSESPTFFSICGLLNLSQRSEEESSGMGLEHCLDW